MSDKLDRSMTIKGIGVATLGLLGAWLFADRPANGQNTVAATAGADTVEKDTGGTLKAGMAKIVITPPVGTKLSGYGGRTDPSTGVLDYLYAKALVLDEGRVPIPCGAWTRQSGSSSQMTWRTFLPEGILCVRLMRHNQERETIMSRSRWICALVWVVLTCVVNAASAQEGKRNLLEEGASFEVGIDGFNLNNQYLLSHHGQEIQPVFDDSTAVHGKYSLRLDNPLGDKIYLTFGPIRLARTADVTVSGYLKGKGLARVQLMRWSWSSVASVDVPLANQWKRFSFEGTIKNDQVYFLWILPDVHCERVWIDALQIEEGELGAFRPHPLSFSLATTAVCNTYQVGEDCQLIAKAHAEKPSPTVRVTISVLDIFRKEVMRKTMDVPTRGETHVQVKIPLFKGNRRGSYKVLAEAKTGNHLEREIITFGVLEPVARPGSFFGFQVKNIFNYDSERQLAENNPRRELVYSNVDPSYVNRLIRLVGATSIRCFRTAEWKKTALRSGGYAWRDSWTSLQKEDGLDDSLIILNAHPPDWVKMIPVAKVKKYAFDKSRKAIPPMADWKSYIRAMITHYKGQSQYFEVVNEPETNFGEAAVYVDYLKEAYRQGGVAEPVCQGSGVLRSRHLPSRRHSAIDHLALRGIVFARPGNGRRLLAAAVPHQGGVVDRRADPRFTTQPAAGELVLQRSDDDEARSGPAGCQHPLERHKRQRVRRAWAVRPSGSSS